MIDKVTACALALLKVGAKPITAFENPTLEATLSVYFYPMVRRQLTTLVPWAHAKETHMNLTPEVGETPSGWEYAYAVPAGVLRILSVGAEDEIEGVVYERRGDRILCDVEEISLLALGDTSDLDNTPEFDDALIALLAAAFVIPLTDSTSRYDVLRREAAEAIRFARDVERAKLREGRKEVPIDYDLISIRG